MQILVAEDNQSLAHSLRQGLEEAGYTVTLAHDGKEAERLARTGPDLILLDRMLPGQSGDAVCQHLRADGHTTPILMLTARAGIGDRVQGLDLGADDYLTKPFAFDELLARIRALLRRGAATSELPGTPVAGLTVDAPSRTVFGGGKEVTLTAREHDLLSLLMEFQGQVVPRETILAKVWGKAEPDASNVVEVYINYLRRKLKVVHQGNLIHNIRGVGYVLRDSE